MLPLVFQDVPMESTSIVENVFHARAVALSAQLPINVPIALPTNSSTITYVLLNAQVDTTEDQTESVSPAQELVPLVPTEIPVKHANQTTF